MCISTPVVMYVFVGMCVAMYVHIIIEAFKKH